MYSYPIHPTYIHAPYMTTVQNRLYYQFHVSWHLYKLLVVNLLSSTGESFGTCMHRNKWQLILWLYLAFTECNNNCMHIFNIVGFGSCFIRYTLCIPFNSIQLETHTYVHMYKLQFVNMYSIAFYRHSVIQILTDLLHA